MTVPGAEALTATLPKCISTVLEIDIGVTMFTEAEAVALAWAEAVLEEAKKMAVARAERRRMFFMSCESVWVRDVVVRESVFVSVFDEAKMWAGVPVVQAQIAEQQGYTMENTAP